MNGMAFRCNFCHLGSSKSGNFDSDPPESAAEPAAASSSNEAATATASPSSLPGSTTLSRRKKFWINFKSKTRQFRSRSVDSTPRRKREKDAVVDDGTLDRYDAKKTEWSKNQPGTIEGVVSNGPDGDGFPDVVQIPADPQLDVTDGITLAPTPVITRKIPDSCGPATTKIAQGTFFVIDVTLREGHDLVIKDKCGTSDPYVKFKVGSRQVYKSRTVHKNLNPRWDERFNLPIEDLTKSVQVKVFDYDRGLNDDPMGYAWIEPGQLEPNVPTELKLLLSESKKGDKDGPYMGFLVLQCTLIPKLPDELEQYARHSCGRASDASKKTKTTAKSSVVNIVLVEGRNLIPMDDNGLSDPYVKFRLGNEKYKSRCKMKTLNPRWLEQFDLYMFEDQTSNLEISVCDHDVGGRDDIMGRARINLETLEFERTHHLEQELEDGAGAISMLLTISGTVGYAGSSIPDVESRDSLLRDEEEEAIRNCSLLNSFRNLDEVGWLMVKVHGAQGLSAADIGGKSDPYCVLELVNSRLQTQTEYKTLAPEWEKVLTFVVGDIHSVLEVTVYDKDRDKKSEFLGKIAIPLLWIKSRKRKWFALKDKKLSRPAKGAIEMELFLIYNDVKAIIRTFNPRERKIMQPEPRFRVPVMKNNIDRVFKIIDAVTDWMNFLGNCFNWKVKVRSLLAFVIFVVVVWNFELYMLPITLLMVFLKNLVVLQMNGGFLQDRNAEEFVNIVDDDDDDETKEEKKVQSLREKLQSIQEVCLQVQETMDMVASLGERLKNVFMWHVPWLSVLAMLVLGVALLVLYFIPLRYLVLLWGISRFTRTLRVGDEVPNNEILDFLSRVPSDKELIEYREFRPDQSPTLSKKRHS